MARGFGREILEEECAFRRNDDPGVVFGGKGTSSGIESFAARCCWPEPVGIDWECILEVDLGLWRDGRVCCALADTQQLNEPPIRSGTVVA